MFKEYILLLLLGHIIGDFYTQTAQIAEKKKNSLEWVLKHGLLYFVTIIVVSIPVITTDILILDVATALLHVMIDVIKFFYLKKKKKETSLVFITDQSLHLLCMIGIAYIWTKNNCQMQEIKMVSDFFNVTNISEMLVCRWVLGLLIIHKPANILIQNLIGIYKPRTNDIEIKADNNAGRVIGSVERVIMLILIYMNQYSAIGLVLTAKSLARYDRISKDEKFAEYYLLGTLISAGIVIGCAALIF